jgi:hypothetical protein
MRPRGTRWKRPNASPSRKLQQFCPETGFPAVALAVDDRPRVPAEYFVGPATNTPCGKGYQIPPGGMGCGTPLPVPRMPTPPLR